MYKWLVLRAYVRAPALPALRLRVHVHRKVLRLLGWLPPPTSVKHSLALSAPLRLPSTSSLCRCTRCLPCLSIDLVWKKLLFGVCVMQSFTSVGRNDSTFIPHDASPRETGSLFVSVLVTPDSVPELQAVAVPVRIAVVRTANGVSLYRTTER